MEKTGPVESTMWYREIESIEEHRVKGVDTIYYVPEFIKTEGE